MTGHEPTDDEGATEREQTVGEKRGMASTLRRRAGNGTLALAAGGVLLARAARAVTRSRRRAAVRGFAGAGLIVLGVRQRRSAGAAEFSTRPDSSGENAPTTEDTGSPDVTFTDRPDEDRPGPNRADDPQRRTGEDQVEIDISEAEPGDEPGEATGSDPEEVQPTRTDDAEPEAGPPGDVSPVEGDVPDEEGTTGQGATGSATTDAGTEGDGAESGMDGPGMEDEPTDAGTDEDEVGDPGTEASGDDGEDGTR